MKNYLPRRVGFIIFAIVGGLCLGFVQDAITTTLLSLPFLTILLIGGLVGWVVCVSWYVMALRFSWLRRFGIQPTLQRLILIVLWWVFTVIGGVAYLGLAGSIAMPLSGMIAVAVGMSMAYNFFLVVLPSFIFWGLQSIPPKSRRARSSRSS